MALHTAPHGPSSTHTIYHSPPCLVSPPQAQMNYYPTTQQQMAYYYYSPAQQQVYQPGPQPGQPGPTGPVPPVQFHHPGNWNMDTCASSHLNNSVTSLSTIFNTYMYPSISVGDDHSIPVSNMGHSILPTPLKPLHLNNVLITPHIVKNLIFVRQFVRDNNCTIEFDAFGFFVKDFMTRRVLLRCDSTGDLYPVTAPSHIPNAFLVSQHTWHQRLGHPGGEVLRRLVSLNFISYNKEKPLVLCHACQLGKHVRLSFVSSSTVINFLLGEVLSGFAYEINSPSSRYGKSLSSHKDLPTDLEASFIKFNQDVYRIFTKGQNQIQIGKNEERNWKEREKPKPKVCPKKIETKLKTDISDRLETVCAFNEVKDECHSQPRDKD
ncbi:ribonuclease H-like domain-containing protein [Tanacetum coccineum]